MYNDFEKFSLIKPCTIKTSNRTDLNNIKSCGTCTCKSTEQRSVPPADTRRIEIYGGRDYGWYDMDGKKLSSEEVQEYVDAHLKENNK